MLRCYSSWLICEEAKAKLYKNIPNIFNSEEPVEVTMGALSVDPKTYERVQKVLEKILQKCELNDNPTKLIISKEDIKKVVANDDDSKRKWILVTCDGLPYKQAISIIKNHHTCVTCGKKLKFLSKLTEHFNSTKHDEFYQTYGQIILNEGHFHMLQTMLRSLVKLTWDVDVQDLCKSILLDTPKVF